MKILLEDVILRYLYNVLSLTKQAKLIFTGKLSQKMPRFGNRDNIRSVSDSGTM